MRKVRKLSSFERRHLPHGSKLGGLSGCDFCSSPDFAIAINGIRLCTEHKRRVDAIARDAKRDASSLRKPECLPFVFRVAVAS